LEQNVDGYSPGGSSSDDTELRVLLQTGTVDDIGEEMDETELVVQQLSHKQSKVQDELYQVQADTANAARYMEKMELQERADELQAQKKVVEGYLKKARHRLVTLQVRYKELIVQGQNDRRAGGRTPFERESYSSSPSPSASSAPNSSGPDRTENRSSPNADESWKNEGFGSFGRGRGSSRRRSQQQQPSSPSDASSSSSRQNASTSRSSTSSSFDSAQSNQSRSTSARPTTSSGPTPSSSQQQYVPPHRRTSFAQKQDDERRLREIKVDEEFDKLKRDLGL
jgi:predicted DNA-binding protein (UPF0251 family)